jgi:hypothetical protein
LIDVIKLQDCLFLGEATMGGLIQTKGTQRLANLFNSRFSVLTVTRGWRDGGGQKVADVFRSTPKLLDISDAFIAQNANAAAAANWPADMNDLLYPSATLKIDTVVNPTTLTFRIPGTQPTAVAVDSAVTFLGTPRFPRNTKVKNSNEDQGY